MKWIAEITYIQNDPYGVFFIGGYIDIYWDETTQIFTVKKDGSDYPQAGSAFIANNSGSTYQTFTMFTPTYCIGTTLYSFYRNSGSWPYIYYTTTPNATACGYSPAPSTLAWSGTPVIKDASGQYTADGSFSLQAVSNYSPIYYGLAGTAYTSVYTITGLGPGSYTWQAQDASGYVINYNFTIKSTAVVLPPPPATGTCDIAWSGTPTIVTDTGGGVGQITFNATSSHGPIQYALHAFNYGDYGVSGNSNFTGLAGNTFYTIYAADSMNCKTQPYTFFVPYNLTCDIAWSGVPTLTQDTGTGNGSIVYSVTTTGGSLQYALHDFTYNDGTAQASGTFNNLTAGNYTIYAVDAKGCKAPAYSFTIPLNIPPPTPLPPTGSSYNIAYQVKFKDLNGVDSVVNIVKKAFNGTTSIVTAGSEPVTYSLRLEGETDKYAPIRAGQLTISLESLTAFQYIDLFTNDSSTFRVQYYKNSSLKFVGKIFPQSYSEPYTEYQNYPINVIATDGLVELDMIDFLDDNGIRFNGIQKSIQLIALALSKLQFNLNIRCAANIYAISMNQTNADDPLDQAYIDTDAYYQGQEALSCLEVIKRILRPYAASICQWDGYWWIIRHEELVGASVPYREFDTNGVYSTNGTFSPIINIKKSTLTNRIIWSGNNAQMNMIIPVGNISVNYKQGLRESVIRNSNFTLVKQAVVNNTVKYSCDLSAFTLVQNSDTVCVMGLSPAEGNDTLDGAVSLNGTGLCYLLAEVTMRIFKGDQIKLDVKYKIDSALQGFKYYKVKLRVEYFSYIDNTTYYLLQDGSWVSSSYNNGPSYVYIYETEPGKYKTFTLKANNATANPNGGDFIRVYAFSSSPTDAEFYIQSQGGLPSPLFSGFTSMKAKPTTSLSQSFKTECYAVGNPTAVLYYELESNTSKETIPYIVRPNDYNSTSNPNQWVLKQMTISSGGIASNTIYYDYINIRYLPSGVDCVEESITSLSPLTTKDTMELTLYHGSPVSVMPSIFSSAITLGGVTEIQEKKVTNSNNLITHRNYIRKSDGTDWGFWKRDAVTESELLQTLFMRSYAAQYRQTCRRLTGTLTNKVITGDTPVYVAPYSMLKDNYDNRFYVPSGYSYMDKSCMYKGEFLEEYDITVGGTSTSGGASTFNSTFNSTFGS